MATGKKAKKKVKKLAVTGIIHIQSTFNNTIITVTDTDGNSIVWSSAGIKGFKGSKKGTPYAAQLAASDAIKKAMDLGMKNVIIYVKGPGAGRESAIRAVQGTGVRILAIKDVTPIPHNGCRPPKKRRV